MNHFQYRGRALFAEDVPVSTLVTVGGTPLYVYSEATLTRHFQVMDQALSSVPHLICYSVKACSTLAVLHRLSQLGSGFDVVSGGELARVRVAGGSPARTVFSGVGKTSQEMSAALAAGILMFNVESAEELEALAAVARSQQRTAPFAIRVNPDIDPKTHRYIATGLKSSKFGVPLKEAAALYARARRRPELAAVGVDCHIGSQLTQTGPVKAAVQKVAELYAALREQGHPLRYLDVGGGLGITYAAERPPLPSEYARVVAGAMRGTGATLIVEPGRVLIGNAGILVTRVLYRKRSGKKTFVVVDAGMNDLIRPALYEAHHEIVPVLKRAGAPTRVDVAGPVCESSDVLGTNRRLVLPRPGDALAVLSAGAYGMSMASNYNSRPRPAEVLVSGAQFKVIRQRESLEDLWRTEMA